jgi:hypothetical protein
MKNPIAEAKRQRNQRAFMHLVERHQIEWGTESYTGKPTLEQIMKAKVVAFWLPTDFDMSITITLHKTLKEIEDYLIQLIWHTNERLPIVRLYQVFEGRQHIKVKAIKVEFER